MSDPAPIETTHQGRDRHTINLFLKILAGCGIALCGGGYWWGGFDFFKGALLGFLIVLLNAIWTKKLVAAMLFGGSPKALATAIFIMKFGLTAAILFLAILKLLIDPLAVLVGLSSLIAAAMIFSLVHRSET